MIDEILAAGFDHAELGYDLRIDLVPGVQRRVAEGAVKVDSVHNYCPVPVGAPRGHPELFTFASLDARVRDSAVYHTTRTIRFAAEMGAKIVISHAGNVEMNRVSEQLVALCEQGRRFAPEYEKLKLGLQVQRDKRVRKHLDRLRESLGRLAPVLLEAGVQLALENLPTWEAIPTELEMEELCREFAGGNIRYWHDIGHAAIRENLGFINQERWTERLAPYMVGTHVHDVAPPARDHMMPPHGQIDFRRLRGLAQRDLVRVIEPAPQTPAEILLEGCRLIREAWTGPAESAATRRATPAEGEPT